MIEMHYICVEFPLAQAILQYGCIKNHLEYSESTGCYINTCEVRIGQPSEVANGESETYAVALLFVTCHMLRDSLVLTSIAC
jgi:hypothetical protein